MRTAELLVASAFSLALGLAYVVPAKADDNFETMKLDSYIEMIRQAHLAYDKKDFPRAFELYERNACGGDKGSQFALGSMYLLGQGTQADGLRAYAWLKAAAETKYPEYVKVLEGVESAIPSQHRAVSNTAAEQTLERYGVNATKVECKPRTDVGSHIKKQMLQCLPAATKGMVEVKRCE